MPVIVADFGPDVQEYGEFGKERSCPIPGGCPICRAVGEIIGHGYYRRKPKGLGVGYVVWIKRWKCKVCKKTFGCLPSFLLRFRHYLVNVLQLVFVNRLENGYSWSETEALSSDEGTPARRTMQRWCVGLEENAPEWLGVVDQTLAQQDSRSPWLDTISAPGEEAVGSSGSGKALLQASMHLLAWGKSRWKEVTGYGLNERLSFLWHWGTQQGLVRLA